MKKALKSRLPEILARLEITAKEGLFFFVKIYIFCYSFSKKLCQIPQYYRKDLEMKAQLQKGGHYLSSALQLMVLLNL